MNAEGLTRTSLELALQTAIGNSSIDKIRYSITQWEIAFQGVEESLLCASELVIVNSTLQGFSIDGPSLTIDALNAVTVGSLLLSLANGPRVSAVSIAIDGSADIKFANGAVIRALGHVPNVDWTWSIHSPLLQYTCDRGWVD
jgi:hypothetical protein